MLIDSLKRGWVYGYLDERRWFWSEWIGESKRKTVVRGKDVSEGYQEGRIQCVKPFTV